MSIHQPPHSPLYRTLLPPQSVAKQGSHLRPFIFSLHVNPSNIHKPFFSVLNLVPFYNDSPSLISTNRFDTAASVAVRATTVRDAALLNPAEGRKRRGE